MRARRRRFTTLGTAVLVSITASCASGTGGRQEPAAPSEAPRPRETPAASIDPVRSPAMVEVGPEAAAASISSDEVREHVVFLASDELGGRDTPSPGLEAAAEYLASEFASYGLRPAGDAGSFLQRWTYEKAVLVPDSTRLSWAAGGSDGSFAFGSDYFLIPSEEETIGGAVVYAGDLGDVVEQMPGGVEGAIVVVTSPPRVSTELLSAMRAARRADAAALLIILHPAVPPQAIPFIIEQIEVLPPQSLAAAGLLHTSAQKLFSAAGLDLDSLAADAEGGLENAVALPRVRLEFQTRFRRTSSRPANVVALVPGHDADLSDTYVLFLAHYDHVGIGRPNAQGDSIYNGADDNASGTALLLEAARAFAALSTPPARSVLFLAVSGEEKGLLGSRHYAEHPTVPLENVVANLNFDMVGRNAPDTVIGIGQEYSSLGALARGAAEGHAELGLVVAPDPDPSQQFFLRSDHVSFVAKGIPALMFTGMDHEDYHQPSDETPLLDVDKVARVARLAFFIGLEIANDPAAPVWLEGMEEEVGAQLEMRPF